MALAGSGQSYWERNAGRYDRALRPLAKPFPRMLELVAEATRGADRVLELAAGTGLVSRALAAIGVSGAPYQIF
jgi:hypothetical protein